MKRLFYFIGLLVSLVTAVSCGNSPESTTTWYIDKVDGTHDTIQARKYWIMTPDSMFIKFEIDDTTRIIYNRSGIVSFRRLP